MKAAQVRKLVALHGINAEVSGKGAKWEVCCLDEAAAEAFRTLVCDVGGFWSQSGAFYGRPGYKSHGFDYCDPCSPDHY